LVARPVVEKKGRVEIPSDGSTTNRGLSRKKKSDRGGPQDQSGKKKPSSYLRLREKEERKIGFFK